MLRTLPTLLVVCLVIVSSQVKAQTATFGFRSGPTFNNVSQTQAVDAVTPELDYLIGFSAGIYAEIPISETFAFRPELAYSQKGFSLLQGANIDLFGAPLPLGVRANTRFDYVDLPLLLKAQFGNEQVKGFVLAGPSLNYAINGRIKTEASGLLDLNISNTKLDLDAINYERFEFAGVVGAGVAFETGFGTISLDGRFEQGVTQLYDIPLVGERVKNQGFAINAGIAIPLN